MNNSSSLGRGGILAAFLFQAGKKKKKRGGSLLFLTKGSVFPLSMKKRRRVTKRSLHCERKKGSTKSPPQRKKSLSYINKKKGKL